MFTVWSRVIEDELSDENLVVQNIPSFALADGLAKTFNELDSDRFYFVEED